MLERRTYEHGITALVSAELERAGILVAFTERTGGVSDDPFATLNVGFTRDDPERVRENRTRLCAVLDIPGFARGWQVHGSGVALVGPELESAGFDTPETAIPDTDALVTDRPGVALSILAADCVPVAVADPDGGRVAVIHAGWRGIVAGVVAAALEPFGATSALVAAIGPAIGPDHYEVGQDVAAAVSRAAPSAVRVEDRGGRTFVDLPRTVAGLLQERGVDVVEVAEVCTACEPERFFSYRRDGETGRQALIAMRR
jgi:YfiH family protein